MFKVNYLEKIGRFKSTVVTSVRLLGLLWQFDKGLLMANGVVVTIPAVTPFIYAYIFKLVIDQVVVIVGGSAPDFNLLALLMLATLAIYITQSLAFSAQDYFTRLIFTKVPIALYNKVLAKISSLDMAYFEDSEFKNTLEKVRDSYSYRPLNMMDNLLFAFQSLIQVVISLVVLVYINPFFILVLLVVAIPSLISRIRESELGWGIWDAQSKDRKKFWYVSDLLQQRDSVKELKLFELPNFFLNELKSLQENLYKQNKALAAKYLGINSILNLFEGIIFLGIIVYIVLEALAKKITVGDISYFTQVITNFQSGIGGLFRNMAGLFNQSLYVASIFEVLDAPPRVVSSLKPIPIKLNKPPLIEFKDVTFAYPGTEKLVLKNFNLILKPGEKIALVGENGSGKTTIIKLLCRFYDVESGEILLNGVSIKDLDLNEYYKSLGVLFQDFTKYEYPVKENISFGKVSEREKMDRIIAAATSAGADPMIKKLKKGYEQMLGRTFEGGVELSLGQWQKVALSRAFFRQAQVLILDEPTASLDPKAEAEIFNRVEKLSKDKTVIIISHRFSTVRNADKIYVIDNGKIVESGSHQELLKINGQYATLFNLQAKGYQ